MMWTRSGWRVEASPFAIMRNSRSFLCAASSFRRIFVLAVMELRNERRARFPQPLSSNYAIGGAARDVGRVARGEGEKPPKPGSRFDAPGWDWPQSHRAHRGLLRFFVVAANWLIARQKYPPTPTVIRTTSE